MNQWRAWDFGGNNLVDRGNVSAQMHFRNYWFLEIGVNRDGESLSNLELRGGPR